MGDALAPLVVAALVLLIVLVVCFMCLLVYDQRKPACGGPPPPPAERFLYAPPCSGLTPWSCFGLTAGAMPSIETDAVGGGLRCPP